MARIEEKSVHTLEEIKEIFKNDLFATEAAGAVIIDAGVRYAKCEMELKRIHYNASNTVMGGAIFTLADFTMAVAANGYREKADTPSVDASMYYMKPSKGSKLIAEATCVKSGRVLNFYEVSVVDDLGNDVAHFSGKTYTVMK